MQEGLTWRNLLGKIISDPRQKQHLAETMNIKPITLERWVRGDVDPRIPNLRSLINNLPQYRDQFLDLLKEEGFEELDDIAQEDTSQEIPSEFYRKVFSYCESTSDLQRFWTISTMILQKALEQLDPERQGMSVIVVRCMTPPEGDTKVRSLRETVGRGTPPWVEDLEHHALFLGAESLAGHVVSLCRSRTVQNVKTDRFLIPAMLVDYEISAAAYPIMYSGRVAGCFLISSTQQNYFLSQTRLTLIQNFTDLLALAIEPEDFYDPSDIQLGIMPDHTIQKKYFANFRDRVTTAMIMGTKEKRTLNSLEAEEYVWRQLETELLQVGTGERS